MATRGRGRILAIKWGMNPNSSSLGVDVTFLLVGAAAMAVATPLVGAWLRWRPSTAAPLRSASAQGERTGEGEGGRGGGEADG